MQVGIRDGDVIISTGAVRRDGTSVRLIDIEYPAVAHYQVIHALLKACEENGVKNPACGVTLTNANFYPGLIEDSMGTWMETGVIAVEMELATLLVMAGMRGLRAGGVLVSDGNLADEQPDAEMGDYAYDPHRDVVQHGVEKMLRIALDALVALD